MSTSEKIRATLVVLCMIISQVSCVESGVETHEFNTEVTRLMDILINSLYTQKEIFLREVISNASDALDKIRFESLTDGEALGENKDLEIRVDINEDEKYITIRDTGVGMTKEELVNNLGTIAKSGTTNYLSAEKEGKINLIGQFGVGFYSTFLAGSKIQVFSKSNKDQQYIWTAETAAAYSIEKDPAGNTLGRGTLVKISLKEDSLQFLNHRKISKLIKKYSEFIDFPIYLNNKKEIDIPNPEADLKKTEEKSEEKKEEQDIEINEETDENEEKKEETPKTIKKTVYEWERVNSQKALWLREKDSIYEEDYIEFFKSISKQSTPPMNWIHFNTEGEVIFNSILYIPNRAPMDFYSSYSTRKNDLKLYVRRVLIVEKHAELIPKYMSFVHGVIDSDELALNVARETLINSKVFKIINQRITKKVIDMISEIAKWEDVDEEDYEDDIEGNSEEKALMSEQELEKRTKVAKDKLLKTNKQRYDNFYNEFGTALKLGVIQDKTNRNKLASLVRWHSTRGTELVGLDEYIKNMKSVQDQIYYFSGEDRKVLAKSPLVVGLVRKGYQVLLCDETVDEYVFNVLREYEKKNIVNVGKGDFKMPDDDELERKKQKFLAKKYEPFISYVSKLLFQKVGSVTISNRLQKEPCVVVADSYGHSSFMDKIAKAQMFSTGANDDNPSMSLKKIMEINPHHKVNQILLERIINNKTDSETEQLVELLYETAAFHSGFSATDSNDFVKRFYKTYSKALGVVSLERKELSVDEETELAEEDYAGENEDVIHLDPRDFQVSHGEEE